MLPYHQGQGLLEHEVMHLEEGARGHGRSKMNIAHRHCRVDRDQVYNMCERN